MLACSKGHAGRIEKPHWCHGIETDLSLALVRIGVDQL
jgi:hypothetical protein